MKRAAPSGKEAVSRTHGIAYRTDVIDVPVRGNGGDVEYMIKMTAGDTLVYSWEVPGVADPQAFLTEFHGHTEPVGGRGNLMFYEKCPGAKANGSLIAPWQGIHGWYWKNNGDAPVVVRLRMAGFYELVPGQSGQPESPFYGNLLPLWASDNYFPLVFSRSRVNEAATHTMTLKP